MRDGKPGICHPLKWNFFGGALIADENPVHGAVREIQEEIGLISKPDDYQTLGTLQDEVQLVHVVRLLHPVEMQSIKLNEGAGFGYFTVSDIFKIDITDMTRSLVSKYLM